MLRLTIAILLVAAAVSEAKPARTLTYAQQHRLGLTRDSGKIVGGTEVDPGSVPWQVSFQDVNVAGNGRHFCGGSIFSENVVITAGHCVAGQNMDNPQNLQIVAGDHTLYVNEGTEQTRAVSKIVLHESYISAVLGNDVALLFLETPLNFGTGVGAVKLPEQNQQTTGNCDVTGWGTTSVGGGGELSNVLLTVVVPVVSDADCKNSYNAARETMICAGEAGKDSCQGDSGGPLHCSGYLAGITSWGSGCANEGFPGVYTEVSYFVDWINNNARLAV